MPLVLLQPPVVPREEAGDLGRVLLLEDRAGGIGQRAAPRAARAGTSIEVRERVQGRFDLVLVDAPCSGSGTWRRAPEAKWRLSEERLAELGRLQREVIESAARHVAPRGVLAYATCSILDEENDAQITRFREAVPDWTVDRTRHWTPGPEGDGFYLCVFSRR